MTDRLLTSKNRSFSLWSFLRNVLSQGATIQLDYRQGAGRYEEFSARLDEAAREREDELQQALSGDSSAPETRSPPSRAAYDARGDCIRQLQEALSQLWSDVSVGGGYRAPTKEKVLAALKVQPEPSAQETSALQSVSMEGVPMGDPHPCDLTRAGCDPVTGKPVKASAHPVAVCGKLDQRGLHCQNPPGHEGDCDGMPF